MKASIEIALAISICLSCCAVALAADSAWSSEKVDIIVIGVIAVSVAIVVAAVVNVGNQRAMQKDLARIVALQETIRDRLNEVTKG